MWHILKFKKFLTMHMSSKRVPTMNSLTLGTYKRKTLIDFSVAQRIWHLIFGCHTVTHGTDLRRLPLIMIQRAWKIFKEKMATITSSWICDITCTRCPADRGQYWDLGDNRTLMVGYEKRWKGREIEQYCTNDKNGRHRAEQLVAASRGREGAWQITLLCLFL